MTDQLTQTPQFFLTAPGKCPYLRGRTERKVFTYLDGDSAIERNDLLTFNGFRRSQNIAYRPICDGCNACISVRIPVCDFKMSQSMKRIFNMNRDLVCEVVPPKTTDEQFSLFRSYLDGRHMDGGMANMSRQDFKIMVEESPINTRLFEYRLKQNDKENSHLIAVALTDVLGDGFSMVYSFYDTKQTKRSLGTMMILDHIKRAEKLMLPYIYLGYWVKGSNKMDYKQKFKPLEYLLRDKWEEVTD
ncbi:arginyltransferase [Bartonella sp. HY761]|uniref:arginyltransferase n=1 Tax=Bartonella sp. HY761 TaxID=2979330 RepID=UPI0022051DE8|nr:arginyltransferase [Bartonella sp. HY761]UXN07707.1 arginyltransferase [Bartonella sp. HY761]